MCIDESGDLEKINDNSIVCGVLTQTSKENIKNKYNQFLKLGETETLKLKDIHMSQLLYKKNRTEAKRQVVTNSVNYVESISEKYFVSTNTHTGSYINTAILDFYVPTLIPLIHEVITYLKSIDFSTSDHLYCYIDERFINKLCTWMKRHENLTEDILNILKDGLSIQGRNEKKYISNEFDGYKCKNIHVTCNKNHNLELLAVADTAAYFLKKKNDRENKFKEIEIFSDSKIIYTYHGKYPTKAINSSKEIANDILENKPNNLFNAYMVYEDY